MKAKIGLFTFATFIFAIASTQANADGECLYHYRVNNIGDGREIKVYSVKGRRLSYGVYSGGNSKTLGSDLIIPDKDYLDTETTGDNISPLKINKGCRRAPIAFNFKWRCEASGNVRESSTFDKRKKIDFYSNEGAKVNKYIDSIKNAPNEAKMRFELNCEGNIKLYILKRSGG